MARDFARLNHILIPKTKAGRDAFRSGRAFRFLRPFVRLYERLTITGHVFFFLAMAIGLVSLEVKRTDTHVFWGALGALVVASLVVSRAYALTSVSVVVHAPPRVTVGERATFAVAIRNDGTAVHQGLVVHGPFLPWDGTYENERVGVASLAAGETSRVHVAARFRERGEHHLDPFRVAAMVPLGLAFGGSLRTSGCRFLVVPKVADVVSVDTPMGRRFHPGGVKLAQKRGDSMDLLGVRPYRPGDPVRDLHARSWAKAGFPVVREFQEEFFSRVAVVLDTDASGAKSSLLDAAVSLAAGVVRRVSVGDALVDVLVFGDQEHALALGRGLGHLEHALDLLACVDEGGPFRGDAVLARLRPHAPRLSSVVFVALAWDDARATFVRALRAEGTHVTCVVVREDGAKSSSRDPEDDGATIVPARAVREGHAIALGGGQGAPGGPGGSAR